MGSVLLGHGCPNRIAYCLHSVKGFVSMITPKSAEMLQQELHNLPFSTPVGEGSFQELKCPKHLTEKFICKDEVQDWLRSALHSYAAWVMEQARPKKETLAGITTEIEKSGAGRFVPSREDYYIGRDIGIDEYASRMREIIEKV